VTTHTLNTWPNIFERIRTGVQPFDIRSDLRIKEGDTLVHREFDPCTNCRGSGEDRSGNEICHVCEGKRGRYTGRTLTSLVTCISSFKQQFGTIVIGLDIINDTDS
jgi:hypothetical protein